MTIRRKAQPKATGISVVGLEALLIYRPTAVRAAKDGHGAPRSQVLENVPFPKTMPKKFRYPERALSLLYGFRDALEEIQHQIQKAERKGLVCRPVYLQVPIKGLRLGVIAAEELPQLEFLSIERLASDARDALLKEFRGELQALGVSDTPRNIEDVGRWPVALGSVVHRHYPRLKVLVYPILRDGRKRKVAALFRRRGVKIVQPVNYPYHLKLPSFLRT